MALEMAQALALVRAEHTPYMDVLSAARETVASDGSGYSRAGEAAEGSDHGLRAT